MGDQRESQDLVIVTDLFSLLALPTLRILMTGIHRGYPTTRSVQRLRRSMSLKKLFALGIVPVTALTACARGVIPDLTKKEI